ncbi:MAG: acyl-CoA thioesterase II [Saprospiraceae bacterium]
MQTVEELIALLTLEQTDDHTFSGTNYRTPWKRVFGGQVLGQALHAAYQTVPTDRVAHSLHGYFVLAGNIDIPITYKVDTIRDGGSFTTRRVVAYQQDEPIFILAASFQVVQEGFDHQITMPNVLPPDVLLPDEDQIKKYQESHPHWYARLNSIHPNAIEFRSVEQWQLESKTAMQPYRHIWMKAKAMDHLDLRMQHQILAYASDYNLLTTAALPHVHNTDISDLFYASLDHALWFHRPFTMQEWLLYALDSPSASGSRGFTRGNIFSRNGQLVASVVQEGVIRKWRQ